MKHLYLIVLLFVSSCNFVQPSETFENDNKCIENNDISVFFIDRFFIENDSVLLDSAMMAIDNVFGNCPDLDILLSFRKLYIFSLQKEFKKSYEFINSLSDTILMYLPYYKTVIFNRFKAMDAQYKNDFKTRDLFLKENLSILENFYKQNKDTINKHIKQKNYNNFCHFFNQYYFYKYQLFDKDSLNNELDSLIINFNVDENLIKIIKEQSQSDFMEFNSF